MIARKLISMYWKVGAYISDTINNGGWGKSIVNGFARFIQAERPDIKGFSASNIWRMRPFYEAYADKPLAGQHAARDGAGKHILVPRDMDFEEWKQWQQAGAPEDIAGWREKEVENSGERGIIDLGGGDMLYTGASGAIPRNDRDRMEKHAALYYEEIRNRTSDIESISKNTGFSVEDICKVKEHVFLNLYDLGGTEPERFEADYDMAVSWQRLIEGKNILEMDLVLLNHELIESTFMNENGLSYNEAHRRAEKLHNYTQHIKALDMKEGIK